MISLKPTRDGRTAIGSKSGKRDNAGSWPLSFIAQIDFAEIHSAGGLEGFPSSGRLLFFCDPGSYPWGATTEDQACASVMFIQEPADRLGRRDFPAEFNHPRVFEPRDYTFEPRRLTPKLWLLPPPDDSRELLALWGVPTGPEWAAAEREAYERFWRDLGAPFINDEIHQAGGIPFSIGSPVDTDCVKFAEDDYFNHPMEKAWHKLVQTGEAFPDGWPDFGQARTAFTARERAKHFERADGWQVVLQIDSDLGAGMQWGDCGRLYVCIRKHDLAERRFDRCWTRLQCS